MLEAERRKIHELIDHAAGGDEMALLTLEEKVLTFERVNAPDDTIYVLDRLRLLGLNDFHERISARLREKNERNTDDRPPWVA